MRLLVDTYYPMVERHAQSQGGCLFRKEADSVWCSFNSATAAVRAALALLEDVEVRNRFLPEGQALRLRAGLHLGDVTVTEAGDLLGHTLSVAKRLETACEAGTVNLSEEVYAQIAGRRLSFEFVDRGLLELKGIGPQRVFSGRLRAERRQELAHLPSAPTASLLLLCGGGPEALRLALRLARELPAESVVDDQAGLGLVWIDPSRALELLAQLPKDPSRCVLTLGPVMRGPEGLMLGSAVEEATRAYAWGREKALLVSAAAARSLTCALEPYGDGFYRVFAGELSYAHHPQRILCGDLDLVVGSHPDGTPLLAASTRAHMGAEAELAVQCAALASARGWAIPANTECCNDQLTFPGEAPITIHADNLEAILGQRTQLALSQAYRSGRLALVVAGPLDHAEALSQLLRDACGEESLQEARHELSPSALQDILLKWGGALPPSPLTQLTRLQIAGLFPDPRLTGHPGWRDLSDPRELALWLSHQAATTLLLAGPEAELKLFHRQLRVQLPVSPRLYLLGTRSEWFRRRGVESLPQLEIEPRESPAPPLLAGAFPTRPYKFLDFYTAGDRAIFFGRDRELEELYQRVLSQPVLVLYGRSGVGKTSLLQAGVLPRLAAPQHLALTLRCLQNPIPMLRQGLAWLALLQETPAEGLLETFQAVTRAISGHLVIVLDQFEEFFVRLSPSERQTFEREVAEVVRQAIPECTWCSLCEKTFWATWPSSNATCRASSTTVFGSRP